MAKRKIAELIDEWMQGYGKTNGYELARVEFLKEADAWYLRVFVEKLAEDGYAAMSTDDCEQVSRFLSSKLDEVDPIQQNYYLEVSSPGLDRVLVTDKDFERFRGETIDLKLFHPLNGKKTFQGKLISFEDGILTITDENNTSVSVPREQISKVNLSITF
ncbi:MAG: ribosome maturation factor RimP [Clostridia bacterium]|nr:ribosome maturation factor RimP [Clostridia bacterium]